MVSICKRIRLGNPIEYAVEKATLIQISESDYKSEMIRHTAASWMRM